MGHINSPNLSGRNPSGPLLLEHLLPQIETMSVPVIKKESNRAWRVLETTGSSLFSVE